MKKIGGNITAVVQRSSVTVNAIGEQVKSWTDVITLKGWLDLASGNTQQSTYDARIQESTHYFVCDYAAMDTDISGETARMVIDGKRYTINLIDDPMGLHYQLEFYLKYVGGQ